MYGTISDTEVNQLIGVLDNAAPHFLPLSRSFSITLVNNATPLFLPLTSKLTSIPWSDHASLFRAMVHRFSLVAWSDDAPLFTPILESTLLAAFSLQLVFTLSFLRSSVTKFIQRIFGLPPHISLSGTVKRVSFSVRRRRIIYRTNSTFLL